MPEWIALRQWLAAPPETTAEEPIETLREPEIAAEPALIENDIDDVESLLGEIRFFRAALTEAIERRASAIAQEVAVEVLARELRIAPADLGGIVALVSARYYSDAILAIRVHPDDVPLLSAYERVVPDATLRRGDVRIELSDGSIDATLGLRLERVLRAGMS